MHGLAKLASAAALTVALMGAAYAQQYHQYLPDKGTSEIDFAASLNFEPTESQALFGRYGYFFNRNFAARYRCFLRKDRERQYLRHL
jgi:hypothetical protein